MAEIMTTNLRVAYICEKFNKLWLMKIILLEWVREKCSLELNSIKVDVSGGDEKWISRHGWNGYFKYNLIFRNKIVYVRVITHNTISNKQITQFNRMNVNTSHDCHQWRKQKMMTVKCLPYMQFSTWISLDISIRLQSGWWRWWEALYNFHV